MCVTRADILDWRQDLFMKKAHFKRCILSGRKLLLQRMAASGGKCSELSHEKRNYKTMFQTKSMLLGY